MIKRLLHKKCSSRFALNVLEWLPLRSSHIQRKNYFKFRGSETPAGVSDPPFSREGSWRKTAGQPLHPLPVKK